MHSIKSRESRRCTWKNIGYSSRKRLHTHMYTSSEESYMRAMTYSLRMVFVAMNALWTAQCVSIQIQNEMEWNESTSLGFEKYSWKREGDSNGFDNRTGGTHNDYDLA